MYDYKTLLADDRLLSDASDSTNATEMSKTKLFITGSYFNFLFFPVVLSYVGQL